jgi:hypothetical protein
MVTTFKEDVEKSISSHPYMQVRTDSKFQLPDLASRARQNVDTEEQYEQSIKKIDDSYKLSMVLIKSGEDRRTSSETLVKQIAVSYNMTDNYSELKAKIEGDIRQHSISYDTLKKLTDAGKDFTQATKDFNGALSLQINAICLMEGRQTHDTKAKKNFQRYSQMANILGENLQGNPQDLEQLDLTIFDNNTREDIISLSKTKEQIKSEKGSLSHRKGLISRAKNLL